MKHISRLTIQRPLKADAAQDIFCKVNSTKNELLQASGGSFFLKDYIDEQCGFNPPS